MPKDWSYGALDDMYLSGQLKRAVEPRFQAERLPRRDLRLGFAGLCLLVGLMATLLYVWPVLLVTTIVAGMSATSFWAILGCGAAAAAVAVWAITRREERHWGEHWQELGDWADSPPWK